MIQKQPFTDLLQRAALKNFAKMAVKIKERCLSVFLVKLRAACYSDDSVSSFSLEDL